MSPYVAITTMNVGGREFVLAEVARGMGKFGVFRATATASTATDVFYIEDEPVINIYNPYTISDTTDKVIHQISAPEKTADPALARFSAAVDNYYRYEQGLARSLMPVLELLSPGLYVVHESEVHPSNGNGKFFWTAYTSPGEVSGTADKNSAIGHSNFTPGFLVPTRHPADFRIQRVVNCEEELKKGRALAGISYHITGMFSALLEGHHAATAALLNDIAFKCLMIEPLNGFLYNNQDGISGLGQATGKSPGKIGDEHRQIVALTCPYVNIPLEELPDDSLERFLLSRKSVKPFAFNEIKPKMMKSARTITKRAFPMAIYDKSEQLPDHKMVEVAATIDFLSEEQLEALLAGEVKYADEYIISSNFHTSISAACNYLQVKNFERFLFFAIDILCNEKLTIVHKYIAERLYGIIHTLVYGYFKTHIANVMAEKVAEKTQEMADAEAAAADPEFEPLIIEEEEEMPQNEFVLKSNDDDEDIDVVYEVAIKYMRRWEEHMEKRHAAENSYSDKRKRQDMNKMKITQGQGIATLEAAAKGIGLGPKDSNPDKKSY